ncbi:hypothetical protein GN156_38290, partial [bacterium LRH843]|nr:hypothetical protein [bacterium LRH843]
KQEDQGSNTEESSEEEDEEKNFGSSFKSLVAGINRDDRKALKKGRKEAAAAKSKARTVEVGDMPSSENESKEDDTNIP